MQLMQLKPEDWKDVASYVDTLCLPVTSTRIQDKEIILENSKMVQYFAEDLERKLIGRLLLLPPIPYMGGNAELFNLYLNEIIKDMEQSSFYYLVLVIDGTLKNAVREIRETDSIKIMPYFAELSKDPAQEEIDEVRESLYQKVLEIWRQT
ncbi:DUF2487 family protein [Thermoactinomyces mirandus]|uniref:DUF2487 family protein n=1 Tax=Thermoactinomyces mirandus TaxID=2756294 RepID=A0A7W1XSP8_9BACL|nr:DUF2487 family protein [Thermoactinomyces mirandus]MBA4602564.1 DUF2487 family protein [Thermoactinomyces mirandus]